MDDSRALTAIDNRELVIAPTRADQHPVPVYLASLAPGSRRTMQGALESIAALLTAGRCDAMTLAWHQLGYQHAAAIRSTLAEERAPATVNKMLSALRGVLLQAWKLKQMAAEDYHLAVSVEGVKSDTLPRGRALTRGEMLALFAACANDLAPAGARDAALIAVMYGGGPRRSEVAGLDIADYNGESGELVIRGGKGRKDRITYVPKGSQEALRVWLGVRGNDAGPLFLPIDKAGKLARRRLTAQAVFYILRCRAKEAGLEPFSPHDLRRTFISDLLDAGADISTVQRLAGHSKVETTAKYDRRGELAKRKAVDLLHVPYRVG